MSAERSSFAVAFPAIVAALAIGSVAGVVGGYFGHAIFAKPKVVVPPVEVIQEEITDEDLANLCKELTEDQKMEVVQAQERVVSLQAQIEEKERAIADYQAKEAKHQQRSKAAAKKWKDMQDEVAALRVQLAQAEEQRDELRVELKKTLVDLDKQIKQTKKFKAKAKHYKAESTKNLWSAFLNNAKVQVCDKGSRKRHAKCHDAVDAAFDQQMRDKFTVCVDTYQAVPVLKQAEKGEGLPQFAQWLPDDNKFTKKGWYVIYCDPTLPEAKDVDLDDEPLPAAPTEVDDFGE